MREKLVQLVQTLKEKSEEGGVVWEQTAEEGKFQSTFSRYSVVIGLRSPSRDVNAAPTDVDYVVSIYNDRGALVEDFDDVELGTHFRDPRKGFIFMRDLYEAARGKAMGVDDAIDAIMSDLSKDEIPF